MKRAPLIVAALLVSSTAFGGRTYNSDANDQFIAPIQAYEEISGKCYPEILDNDDPDPVQYVEIIFRNDPDHGGLYFAISHHSQRGITYVRQDQYNVEIVQFYQDNEVWWAGSRKARLDTMMFGRLFFDRSPGIGEGDARTNFEMFKYEERVGSRREVQRKGELADYELITRCYMHGGHE
jgi:hypothetical protein